MTYVKKNLQYITLNIPLTTTDQSTCTTYNSNDFKNGTVTSSYRCLLLYTYCNPITKTFNEAFIISNMYRSLNATNACTFLTFCLQSIQTRIETTDYRGCSSSLRRASQTRTKAKERTS